WDRLEALEADPTFCASVGDPDETLFRAVVADPGLLPAFARLVSELDGVLVEHGSAPGFGEWPLFKRLEGVVRRYADRGRVPHDLDAWAQNLGYDPWLSYCIAVELGRTRRTWDVGAHPVGEAPPQADPMADDVEPLNL